MSTKRFWFSGILGCLFFGIGDWLLGCVDPGKVEGKVFYYIREGHGAGFSTSRFILTIITAMIGICFLFPAVTHIGNIAVNPKVRRALRLCFGFGSIGWVTIHFIAAANVLAFSLADSISRETAAEISLKMSHATEIPLYLAYFLVAVPLVLLTVLILMKKTSLPRTAAIYAPLLPMLIIFLIAKLMPENAFSYGLYTFAMNGGLWVWFRYLLAKKLMIGLLPEETGSIEIKPR